jgi:DNA end-binding protein Ku
MARTVLNTTLDFGVISIPVALRKVGTKADVKLDRASLDGNKIGRQEIDTETGEILDRDSIQYGVWDGDEFRAIPQDAIDAIEAETKIEEFNIDYFIPLKDVPFERATAAYYLAPQTGVKIVKPLKLLAEALAKTKRAAALKLCLNKRQYPAVIYERNGGLYVNLLSYASDFREADEASEVLAGVKTAKAELDLAIQLVEAQATDADVLDMFEDDLVVAKQKLVEDALAGRKVTKKPAPKKPAAAADDMLAKQLEASIAQAQAKRKVEALV